MCGGKSTVGIDFFALLFEDAIFAAGFGSGEEVAEVRFLEFAVEEALVAEGLAVGEGVFVVEFWVAEVLVCLPEIVI